MEEIERKFLVEILPDLASHRGEVIQQGYLAVDPSGSVQVRLRRKGERFFETVKQGEGVRREEREIELTEAQFEALWPMTEGFRLEKRRYEIPHGGQTIELDVYRNALEGLVVAEVEFASVEKSRDFEPPAWFGREVTHDQAFQNVQLARGQAIGKGG